VKHRSPLITLAAVALAFAIMFIVNMTASPPGNSSTGTASPPAAPATAAAGSPSPTESAAASPSPEDSKFPEKIVYAGRAEDNAGKDGATLEAKLDGNHVKGTAEIKSEKLKFEMNEAKKPAGLYRARDRMDRA
jgi:hypothetical protein